MHTITLYDYIALLREADAKQVIRNFGYGIENCHSKKDLVTCLKQFVNAEGEKGLLALAAIHPDRELILTTQKNFNADGFNGQPALPATNNQQPATSNQQQNNNQTTLLTGSLIAAALLLSAAIIFKK